MQRLAAVLITVFLLFSFAQTGEATVNPFPSYPSIEPNVTFWKKVYAEYPSTQGFIHDGDDLSIIYAIIDLLPRDKPGSSKANRRQIKGVREKYRKLLRKMAKGEAGSLEAKRVAEMFGSSADSGRFRQAAKRVRFQLCQKDRFRKGLVRSGRYLSEIKKIFIANSLPSDLAYLPHVESSFNYEAYSKFGAAGIWQFIRSTGRRFMTISYTLDERRDPIVASHAAAKYLKENYQKLGSWPLALTAYNHGPTSMVRAKRKHGDYETICNKYQNKRFGFASKNFYAEFLAAREIAKNYKKYFNGLVLDKPLSVVEIKMNGYAAVDDIVDFFQVDRQKLRSLNPALRKPVFGGQKYIPKGYSLRLPADMQGERTAVLPPSLYKKNQKRSRFYRVTRGDTAGKIARMHRVRLRDLVDSNQLGRRATIYVGQNLRIPVPGEKKIIVAAKKNDKKLRKSMLVAQKNGGRHKRQAVTPLLVENKKTKHESGVAESNDVLISKPEVAQAKKVEVEQVNVSPVKEVRPVQTVVAEVVKSVARPAVVTTPTPPLPPTPVRAAALPRQQLAMVRVPKKNVVVDLQIPMQVVHGSMEEMEIAEGSPAIEEAPQGFALLNSPVVLGNFGVLDILEQGTLKVGVVQVEYMETLGHYADWLEIPTQKIRSLNKLSFRRQITAHKKIKIPFGKVDQELFEERRYEFHKEVEEDFFAAYKVVALQNYTIKKGDNIWSLGHDTFELPFWLMRKFNPNLDFNALQLGQKLTVPVVENS